MASDSKQHGDGPAAETLRGVLFIVVVGLALGALHNAIGRASRPPFGLAWVKPVEQTTDLVSLAPAPVVDPAPAPSSDPKPPVPVVVRKPAAPVPVTSPPADPPAPRAQATPAPAGNLPVIPNLDRPIRLELGTLKKLYDAGAVLVVDAREGSEYADGHITGAASLPFNDALTEPDRIRQLGAADRPIAVYCSGGACELSMDLAKLMIEQGRRKVLVYEGGYPEWEAAGYPVSRGAEPGGR